MDSITLEEKKMLIMFPTTNYQEYNAYYYAYKIRYLLCCRDNKKIVRQSHNKIMKSSNDDSWVSKKAL